MRIKAVIANITYYNEQNSFVILRLKFKGEIITAKGVCPDLDVIGEQKAKGLSCTLEGEWITDPRYGEQFDASAIDINTSGMLFFLSNIVKGLGQSLAKRLMDTYGDEKLADILDNSPGDLLKVKGIKEKKLKKITESWQKYRNLKTLTEFFANNDVPVTRSILLRIYNHFKDETQNIVKIIEENPYCLTEIRSIGFKTTDKLALQMGVEPYSGLRIKALADYILLAEAGNNGHTYLRYEDLLGLAIENMSSDSEVDSERLDLTLRTVLSGGFYYVEGDRVALKRYKTQEEYIERNFKSRLERSNDFRLDEDESEKFISEQENKFSITLGEAQRKAVMNVTTRGNNVFALCGYAGTGKSTVSRIMLSFYENHFRQDEIITCAFTGMASKRISEVTGYNAKTIHSLLGFKGKEYTYNKEEPLPYKVILVDEASMINLGLFYALIRAVPDDAVVILVGDDAQLPPIGEGNVFADLLAKDWVPKVHLDRIYRQSEDSVLTYFAGQIRQGRVPDHLYENYRDFAFIHKDIQNYWKMRETLSEKELREVKNGFYSELQDQFLREIENHVKKYNLRGTNKIWNVQTITAMKATPVGTETLNNLLQKRLNDISKDGIKIKGCLLKKYDKVIHLKNQNMITLDKEEYDESVNSGKDLPDICDEIGEANKRVYNGNLGMVLDIDEENELFSVAYPELNGSVTVTIYNFDDYRSIVDLGYALTIHKTQGNQFDYVFIPLINAFYKMLNTKLLYTAITRAKKKCVLMGQSSALKRGCTNMDDTQRNTFLGISKSDGI